ncbi:MULTISPECIES: arylsulfatase [unclassified Ruegeria]|uniref:arylsulfatase n=1 Tax=unclassified Ruegeria TaxID=2625375 RepID=UPI0012685C2E|nr:MULTISPECIES: arylsulfatase [unclassified Ruegeria]QFT75633.1 Arylsulfatase [Ruegeria sp. THAF33]UAB91023.1 arylsulfatase [Ruegeria sp. SCSIO 43209]
MRRIFPLFSAFAALGFSAAAAQEDTRPNFLILIADDMGFSDVGAFGSEIETPNIDQLAAQGMLFTNFHVGASCSPTRTMLISGVDNHLAGLGNMLEIQADNQFGKPGYEGHLNDSVVTVATLLRDAGYHTYMAGKWHLGHDEDTIAYARGFDRSFMLGESGADNWVEQPYAPFYERVHYYEDNELVSLPTEDYFSTEHYTDTIIDYIDSNIDDGKPFLAWVGYQAVHYPHQAPKPYIDKYDGVYDSGFADLRDKRLERQVELGVVSPDVALDAAMDKTSYDPWRLEDWDALSGEEQAFHARRMQTYAGMLDNMDENIGEIFAYLEEKGELDNTVILFLSDNGPDPNQLTLSPDYREWYEANYDTVWMEDYQGDFSSMGQQGVYADYGPSWAAAAATPASYYKTFSTEGGLRVPLIVRYPEMVAAGTKVESFAFVLDIVPTLLELAGVETPGSTYQGREINPPSGISMVPVLTGALDTVRDEDNPVGYELAGSSAVFKGRYKLSQNPPPKGTGEWELYDTIADPSEINNLAAEMPDLVAEMQAFFDEYAEEVNLVPVPEGYNPLEQTVINAQRGGGLH